MQDSPETTAPTSLQRLLAALTVLSAGVFALLLGIRTLTSPDLGYHLAYGDEFWSAGRIVDHNPFVYTLPENLPGPRLEPGPGCWYDQSGRYRCPNANWLSQVIMSGVHRIAGPEGLTILAAALVAGIFALLLATMRRLGVPRVLAAAGVLLAALTTYERLGLRPEVFGYLLLIAQACLLTSRGDPSQPMRWPMVAGLILLQVLLVNLHSYFLLGLGLTLAVLADRLLRLAWRRLRNPNPRTDERTALLARGTRRLGLLLAGQIAACFANPWTWRLAALPVQTILFLHANGIGGLGAGESDHPWSMIGEFFAPFAMKGFIGVKATYAYCALLGLAASGGLAALLRGRWAWLFLIAAMTLVSVSMRRNIAPAALLVTPVALAAIWQAASPSALSIPRRVRTPISLFAAAAVIVASAWFVIAVVTQRFYYNERSPNRFGLGLSRIALPVEAAEWLSDPNHAPAGRLWCDYGSSSNLHYFTRPHRDVPILTNTWACPPEVMREVLDCSEGRRRFGPTADRLGVEVVALRADGTSAPLVHALARDPRWRVVFLGALDVVFLRADGANAAMATRFTITPETLDLAAYEARLRSVDPRPAHALHAAGTTLHRLGWGAQAVEVLREAVALDEDYFEARNMLGLCLAGRGQEHLVLMVQHQNNGRLQEMNEALRLGRNDWVEARECFRGALRIRPDYAEARQNLANINQQLEELEQHGKVVQMQYPF